MSAEQLEDSLMKLPREERRRFAQCFNENENDILEPEDNDPKRPGTPEAIVRHINQVITASLETMKVVKGLPPLA